MRFRLTKRKPIKNKLTLIIVHSLNHSAKLKVLKAKWNNGNMNLAEPNEEYCRYCH